MPTKKECRNRQLSPAKKAWITRKVKSGKTKYQIAEELNLPRQSVYYWTKDIPSKNCGWPGIRGKTLDLLQEIICNGYASSTDKNVQKRYMVLRKYFPTICKVTIYRKYILFLKGKEDEAAKAFLKNTRKKIISYQELKQVTEVFGIDLSKKEKDAFILKKRGKIGVKNQVVQKGDSLPKKDDSFSFFYIREYC